MERAVGHHHLLEFEWIAIEPFVEKAHLKSGEHYFVCPRLDTIEQLREERNMKKENRIANRNADTEN